MLMLVSPMVSIHISNWVDPIAFFTIKGVLYIFIFDGCLGNSFIAL